MVLQIIGIIFVIICAIFFVMGIVAIIMKPSSVYKNKPEEQNPMEGKRVVFIENPDEPANADGVCGHLEAVGQTVHIVFDNIKSNSLYF